MLDTNLSTQMEYVFSGLICFLFLFETKTYVKL